MSHDFVTGEQQGEVPAACNAEGGLTMWVSADACKEGHEAINRLGATCDGAEAPLTFDFEELAANPSTSFTSTKSGLTLTVTRHDNASMGMQDQNFFIPALTDFGHRTIVNLLGPSTAPSSDAALVLNFSALISRASISFGDVGDPFPRDDDSPVVLTAFSGPNGTGSNLGSVSVLYPDSLGFGIQGNGAIRTLTVDAAGIQSLTISSGGNPAGSLYYDNVVVQR